MTNHNPKPAIKERPILFSAPMVRAILDGRKTQTRRVIKPQPDVVAYSEYNQMIGFNGKPLDFARLKCKLGRIGDTLWVRETWHPESLVIYCGFDPNDLIVPGKK